MWGLTGNMDPRLVSDGKALDVAYDAGEGNPKRTAEVTINGERRGFSLDSLCHFMFMSLMSSIFLYFSLWNCIYLFIYLFAFWSTNIMTTIIFWFSYCCKLLPSPSSATLAVQSLLYNCDSQKSIISYILIYLSYILIC